MVDAGFDWVFVGIETPSIESLKETHKLQNTKRSLIESVHAIQNAGLLVYGGFIIGFDSDSEDIFDRQIEFITDAAIPVAMVGLLGALPGTPLFARLQDAGRLKGETFAGDNQCGYTNIVTILPQRTLSWRDIGESSRRIYTSGRSSLEHAAVICSPCLSLPSLTWASSPVHPTLQAQQYRQ